ncbi:UPF0587 protein [Artemisia annua]|uniref:UPF0587 protein n=1 Tax=Artemisia annua TaxID=35608 RepID=A0A2U1P5I8_ARTAN|nr:UPF0587 protein [Artemisia annua]
MTKYILWVSARLENMTNLQPMGGVDDPRFCYIFKLRCRCGDETKNEVCVTLSETQYYSRQEPKTNLVKKCKECRKTGTITLVPGEGFPLTENYSRRGRAAPLMQFRCNGYEPFGFVSNSLWRAERGDGIPILDIDLNENEGFAYPPEDGEEGARITNVEFEFRHARFVLFQCADLQRTQDTIQKKLGFSRL